MHVDPAGGKTRFGDYAEPGRTGQVHRPSTVTQCETYLRLQVSPTLGCRPIGAIGRRDIQAWVEKLSEHLAPGCVELV